MRKNDWRVRIESGMLKFEMPMQNSFSSRCGGALMAASFVFFLSVPVVGSETWTLPAGGSWNTAVNWNPASIPNAAGANATFNGAATALNPAQTGNRTVTLDAAQTVGSILFNNDLSTFTNSLTVGSSGSLTLDGAGAGPAIITTTGSGTGNNTISAPITLTDSLVAVVNNTTASSAAGSLNLTAAISGAGGFTKEGQGLATFGTGAKTYTGATVLNGGRMRISFAASPIATSSFTINAGAQLTLISGNQTYTFGSGPLNLNGAGAVTPPFAAFPGAIRNDTNIATTITNPVVLQSDTLVHVQGSASGSLTFPNVVSGPGRLTLTAPGSDANLGVLVLDGANTYSGGTTVHGGTISVGNTSPTATLGAGDVLVESGNAMFGGAIAKLTIQTGVLNAIADNATLSLVGGNVAGLADDGYVDLGLGVNEVVGGLVLGGIAQSIGTYGSSLSAATFKNDEYFAGSGIVTVIPEPGVAVTILGGLTMLVAAQRFRKKR
jgi:autotransporter-associated beta strand protein